MVIYFDPEFKINVFMRFSHTPIRLGGQPADSGLISSVDGSSVKFEVTHVQKPKGCDYIEHIGKYTTDLQ